MGDWNDTLPTPSAGSVVTDTDMIGKILPLLDALTSAGTPYNPGWYAATTNPVIGNGSITGTYRRVGKWGDVALQIIIGSTSTMGSGSYEFELPAGWALPAGAWNNNQGIGNVFDTSASVYYACTIGAVSGNTNRFRLRSHSLGNLNATNLVTLATGDQISARITTELT